MISVPQYYQKYHNKVANLSLLEALKHNFQETILKLENKEDDFGEFAYSQKKWTVNELLQHCIDTERIFTYRALSISRGETKDLLGFDQDEYVTNMDISNLSLTEILTDFKLCRASTVSFFISLSTTGLKTAGLANAVEMTPEIIGRIIAGHCLHHFEVLEEKYF